MPRSSDTIENPATSNPAEGHAEIIQVIIETPRGCRNKFAFDAERRIFALSRVLPAGMVFPLDFGFVPGTKAPDGDPLDVLVAMDEPAYPGIAAEARVIGILEGEQCDEVGVKSRNDRLLAVAVASQAYASVTGLDQVPKVLLTQLEEFFVNYHRLQQRQYEPLGWRGVDVALECIRQATVQSGA